MFFIYWKVRWNLFSEVFRSLRGHMDITHKKNKTGWHPILTMCSWIICFVWGWITAKTFKQDFLQKEQLALQKDAIQTQTLDDFLMNRSSTVMRAPRPGFENSLTAFTHTMEKEGKEVVLHTASKHTCTNHRFICALCRD